RISGEPIPGDCLGWRSPLAGAAPRMVRPGSTQWSQSRHMKASQPPGTGPGRGNRGPFSLLRASSMDRHFLKLSDLSADEIRSVIERAIALRAQPALNRQQFAGRTLAMIFMKNSTRTRVSFEAGM